MGRILVGTVLSACLIVALPGAVLADHVGQTIDCGSAGTFVVEGHDNAAGFDVPKGETNLFKLEGTNSNLVIKTVHVNGILRMAKPGFLDNGSPTVTCTFTGPRTGSLYTVTGILT